MNSPRADGLLGDAVRMLREERAGFAVLAYAALSVVIVAHLSTPRWLPGMLPPDRAPLAPFITWVAALAVLWGVLPLIVARALGFGPRRLGLGLGELRGFRAAYGVLYLVALAGVLVATTQPAFLRAYPMVERDPVSWSWSLLLGYWLLYGAQFFFVEFFFRGFLLFSLRPRLGDAAIPVMVVPYALAHIGKPPAEALLAIGGGAVLGWLALRAGTIWGGVVLHTAMAYTMDAAVLTVESAWPVLW